MNFKDCYKILIRTLRFDDFASFDWSKISDVCVDSNDENVSIYKYNPITAKADTLWYGSGANGGSLCTALPLSSKNGG